VAITVWPFGKLAKIECGVLVEKGKVKGAILPKLI
jgi:hypothetical protein